MRCRGSFPPLRPGRLAAWSGISAGLLLAAGRARADGGVTVRAESVAERLEAYAEVKPVAVLPVRAAQTGVIAGCGIVPGAFLRAGEPFASLGGPAVAAAMAESESAMRSARTGLAGALQSLAIERLRLADHLSTRQAVLRLESGAAQARAALAAAEAGLRARREQLTLSAPVSGTVLSVEVAEGERVTSGETILTLEPAGSLWLRASFYGSDATEVRPGMKGEFTPAGGGPDVPVRVRTVFGGLAPDGGAAAGLQPVGPSPAWRNGEYGTVRLAGRTRSLVAVPTRAMILDQGKWWVLVAAGGRWRPREVVPGPVRGWLTFLQSGLAPGARVLVDNAYLEFHRGISGEYQPPD